MRPLTSAIIARPLSAVLILSVLLLATVAGPAEAMLIPSAGPDSQAPQPDRAGDLARVQRTLELKTVQQRLQDHGLTTDEAMVRIGKLSDEQLHLFAANTDAVQAGGDVLLEIFLIAAIVVLIIFLLEGRIVVKK